MNLSHEDQLESLDRQYKSFLGRSHSPPINGEIYELITLVEGYRLQADLLLLKAAKLEKRLAESDPL